MSELVERLKRTENPVLRHALLRARGSMHWAGHGHVARRRAVERYLADTAEPKLHIGAGPQRIPGWLDTDLISGEVYVDLGKQLPFADGTFAYAFGEHVIEHLSQATGAALLRELHRVLRPGGVVRLTTPDLQKVISIYEDRNPVVSRDEYAQFLAGQTGKTYDRPSRIFNDYTRLWGHQWIYDEEDLAETLREAGFRDVTRHETGQSEHEALRDLERHGGAEWVNRAEAMCLEAVRA